jgi:hypothetical protein
MALVSGGTMICWCRCSTHGEREGKAALVGWGAAHLVGCCVLCQGRVEGQKKAGSGNLTSRLSRGCFPSSRLWIAGKILSKYFPFRPFFHIFRDVTNYPDLKQSRFGAWINGKTGRREILIVDSQKNFLTIRVSEYNLSLMANIFSSSYAHGFLNF